MENNKGEKIPSSFVQRSFSPILFKLHLLNRAKMLITRVGDQGPTFYKRDILKLSDEITKNFANENSENKELILKHFVEA